MIFNDRRNRREWSKNKYKEIYDMVTKVNENVIILTQEFKSEFKNVNEKISQLKSENIAQIKKMKDLKKELLN